MEFMEYVWTIGFLLLGTVTLFALTSLLFRRVVDTNEVHIVQRSKKTVSYGSGATAGNVYYRWPSWMPVLGVTVSTLPVSVFDLFLSAYEAYDKGRLPFVVDVMAFFRISDSNMAAQRVSSFEQLHSQLTAIVQGAVRMILANSEIEEIMQERSKFGDLFTKEVGPQLVHWGVEAIKNIELMDIRDHQTSEVIHNIMAKKQSHIEMESRQTVAKNKRDACMAEVEANKDLDVKKQEAAQLTGLRTVESAKQVELARQASSQTTKEQERLTKQKEMAVLEVQSVRTAEIQKQVVLVQAEQAKQARILEAEAGLETKKKEAEATTLLGDAKASAERAFLLAPVTAQTTLAKEIGSNAGYQTYLLSIRQIEATEAIGMEQAKALSAADIKVIANTETPTTGLNKVMDLFSSKGGIQAGAMLEGLSNTPVGKSLLERLTTKPETNGLAQ